MKISGLAGKLILSGALAVGCGDNITYNITPTDNQDPGYNCQTATSHKVLDCGYYNGKNVCGDTETDPVNCYSKEEFYQGSLKECLGVDLEKYIPEWIRCMSESSCDAINNQECDKYMISY